MMDHLKKVHKMNDTQIAGPNKFADKLKQDIRIQIQTKIKDHFSSRDSDSSVSTVCSQSQVESQSQGSNVVKRKKNLKAAQAFVEYAISELISLTTIEHSSTINFIRMLGALLTNTDISSDTVNAEFKSRIAVNKKEFQKSVKNIENVSLSATSYIVHDFDKVSMLNVYFIDENWTYKKYFLSYNCQLKDNKFPIDWIKTNISLYALENKSINFTSSSVEGYAKRNVVNNKCFGHLSATLLHEKTFQKQLKSAYQKVLDCITNIYMLERTLLDKEREPLKKLILLSSEKSKI